MKWRGSTWTCGDCDRSLPSSPHSSTRYITPNLVAFGYPAERVPLASPPRSLDLCAPVASGENHEESHRRGCSLHQQAASWQGELDAAGLNAFTP
eukprot:762911-Hanusia_phi.AAC.4